MHHDQLMIWGGNTTHLNPLFWMCRLQICELIYETLRILPLRAADQVSGYLGALACLCIHSPT